MPILHQLSKEQQQPRILRSLRDQRMLFCCRCCFYLCANTLTILTFYLLLQELGQMLRLRSIYSQSGIGLFDGSLGCFGHYIRQTHNKQFHGYPTGDLSHYLCWTTVCIRTDLVATIALVESNIPQEFWFLIRAHGQGLLPHFHCAVDVGFY